METLLKMVVIPHFEWVQTRPITTFRSGQINTAGDLPWGIRVKFPWGVRMKLVLGSYGVVIWTLVFVGYKCPLVEVLHGGNRDIFLFHREFFRRISSMHNL
jgi:hypothetical protein